MLFLLIFRNSHPKSFAPNVSLAPPPLLSCSKSPSHDEYDDADANVSDTSIDSDITVTSDTNCHEAVASRRAVVEETTGVSGDSAGSNLEIDVISTGCGDVEERVSNNSDSGKCQRQAPCKIPPE